MKIIRRFMNIPVWMELAAYSAISVYILYLLRADICVLDSLIPQQWQTGWRSIPFEFAVGLVALSATLWASLGSMATLFELVVWFIDPNDSCEERECRSIARWAFGILSPIGAVTITLALCVLVVVGVPCGIFCWIFRACRPALTPSSASC